MVQYKERRKETTNRKPSCIRDHRHEVLSIEQDNVSDMGLVRKNLWNKRRPSDDAQSEESGGVLVVPAVVAAKSSSRNYHDYDSSSEEEVEDLSNVSCRKGKKGKEIFDLMDWNSDADNLSVEPKDEITYLMLQMENTLHKRTNASGKSFAPDCWCVFLNV
jgi:hypothetical protein